MKKVKSQPVNTMLTISTGFIVIFLITNWKWALFVALAIGLFGMFSPYISRKIDYLWMKLAYLLGLIIPNIILSLIFFLFLFPISILSKLFGKKDPLILTNKGNSIYKITSKSFDKKSFEKPW